MPLRGRVHQRADQAPPSLPSRRRARVHFPCLEGTWSKQTDHNQRDTDDTPDDKGPRDVAAACSVLNALRPVAEGSLMCGPYGARYARPTRPQGADDDKK
jgi:hypothetical protein